MEEAALWNNPQAAFFIWLKLPQLRGIYAFSSENRAPVFSILNRSANSEDESRTSCLASTRRRTFRGNRSSTPRI
jgi:hypothetical protein